MMMMRGQAQSSKAKSCQILAKAETEGSKSPSRTMVSQHKHLTGGFMMTDSNLTKSSNSYYEPTDSTLHVQIRAH